MVSPLLPGLSDNQRRTVIALSKRLDELEAVTDALTTVVEDHEDRLGGLPVVQSGVQSVAAGATNGYRAAFTFPVAFDSVPELVGVVKDAGVSWEFAKVVEVSETGGRFRTGDDTGAFNGAADILWIAVQS